MSRQLGTAIIAFVIAVNVVMGVAFSRHEGTLAAISRTTKVANSAVLSDSINQTLTYIETQINANPAVDFDSTTINLTAPSGETTVVTFYGDTTDDGRTSTTNATAANLNSNIHERRVNAYINTDSNVFGEFINTFTFDVVQTQTGYVATLDEEAADATSFNETSQKTLYNTNFTAADADGCNGTGTGCDPRGVQTADPSLTGSETDCIQGNGSGTCPSSGVFVHSIFTNTAWLQN
jgi:hypothetical protein